MNWDPSQYGRFATERARPFLDLLAHVPREEVRLVADLGCGPGELTRLLCQRWPQAKVIGVDNSPEMLAQSGQWVVPGRLEFVQADLSHWRSQEPLDLIFSNAAFQWVPNHEGLLAALADMLAPGGVLAVQIPYHFDSPAHRVVEEVTSSPRWSARLSGVGLQRGAVRPFAWYVERLLARGFTVDAWQTTYLHVLQGANPVLEWMKGTALRPLLGALTPTEADEFLQDMGAAFHTAYPKTGQGVTLFQFPRIFFVATRPQ
jgi:trans-aconitate 2-methyltransferase